MDAASQTVALGALWLPILVSGAIAFVASSLIWTALKWHDGDWKRLPDEASVLEAIRKTGAGPGQYHFPSADPRPGDAEKRAWAERYAAGPVGVLFLGRPGTMPMGKMMVQMVLYFLVVSFFVAYIAAHSLPAGADHLAVFRIVGATAFVAYGSSQFVDSIWFHRSWRASWLAVLDALVYACLSAGVFGWLWPGRV